MGHGRRVADIDNSVDQFPLLLKLPVAETNHRFSLEFEHLGAARGRGTHLKIHYRQTKPHEDFDAIWSTADSVCPAYRGPFENLEKLRWRVRRNFSEVVSCSVRDTSLVFLGVSAPISETSELLQAGTEILNLGCILLPSFETSAESPSSGSLHSTRAPMFSSFSNIREHQPTSILQLGLGTRCERSPFSEQSIALP